MTKRELTKPEIKIIGIQLERLRKELDHLYYLERYNDFMLNEGLKRNFEEKVREFKQVKEQIIGDIHITINQMTLLQNQVKFGVEEKKAPTGVD